MEYKQFERDFIKRTLKIIEQYNCVVEKGVLPENKFEVTLLINCLLGLLILPNQLHNTLIKTISIEDFKEWGFQPEFIKNRGNRPEDMYIPHEIIRHMRNSVAHMKVRVCGDGIEIKTIEFKDRNGFRAVIPVTCLRTFIVKLAESLLI